MSGRAQGRSYYPLRPRDFQAMGDEMKGACWDEWPGTAR